ncbi:hypothetical protein KKF55_00615 [Patescibacteria group bacterium]|nr:hypothetical protein [Patescibacteria group bacterium]
MQNLKSHLWAVSSVERDHYRRAIDGEKEDPEELAILMSDGIRNRAHQILRKFPDRLNRKYQKRLDIAKEAHSQEKALNTHEAIIGLYNRKIKNHRL